MINDFAEPMKPALSTTTMVLILLGVVKGVFISFALMALCYRYSGVMKKNIIHLQRDCRRAHMVVVVVFVPCRPVISHVQKLIVYYLSLTVDIVRLRVFCMTFNILVH